MDNGGSGMNTAKYGVTIAAREHLAAGKPITQLEAMILYGVSNLYQVISDLRRKGWVIESKRISYVAAVKRINEFALVKPPTNLPVKEIQFTEYWVSQ